MQFSVLVRVCVCEKEQIRRAPKGKHLAFTYVTKNNGQEAIFIGADEWGFFFVMISHMLQIKELCILAKIAFPWSQRCTRNTDCVLFILIFAHMMCFLVPSPLILLFLTQNKKKGIILYCITVDSG